MTMIVDATFSHVKKTDDPKTSRYAEYRKEWNTRPVEHRAGEYPVHIDLEVASGCNLKCSICYQSFAPPERGFMSMELFKKVIDECEGKVYSFKPNFRGEPLLHPQIAEMLKYVKDKGFVETMMNSNCMLLTSDMSKKLIDAHLDKLICSVDGCTADVYESIRIGAKFDTVLENIKYLQSLKKELGVDYPKVRIQMVDQPKNHEQMQEYVDFWSNIADDVGVELMNDWHPKEALDKVVKCKDFECSMLYQRMIVLWDGRVVGCCGNNYAKLVLGNVAKQSVKLVWNGVPYNTLRYLSESGDTHLSKVCSECGYRTTVINHNKFPTNVEKANYLI